mgnify:CR=1 FL=1
MKIFAIVFAILLFAIIPAEARMVPITLAWNANTEADLDGYEVYVSTTPNSPWETRLAVWSHELEVMANPTTTFEIDMNEGETRYFRVTAFDLAGNESQFSNEVFFYLPASGGSPPTPPPVDLPPAPPGLLRVVPASSVR